MIHRKPETSMELDPASRVQAARAAWLRYALLAVCTCALLPSCAIAQEANASQTPQPLATIDGQPVTDDQLPAADQAQLTRMMGQVYAVKLRALHTVLDQKLIAAEAKKKGVSADELFKSEILAKVPEPTEDQVKAYYASRTDPNKPPYDDVKDKMRQNLKDLEVQKEQAAYIQGLWQQAAADGELVILMTPPKIEIAADPARLRGDPRAPVTIVEFSDFSCPFCRKAESILTEVLAKYPGQVKLGYRDFPLETLHPQAELAAEASRCAGDQGKYWEYHDLLFARPDMQKSDVLLDDARTLKLDEQKFAACLSSGSYKAKVDQDVQMGSRAGVVATPGFFINGTFVNGAQPAAVFEKIIDQQLAQKLAANQQHPAN
jgi:protein-disulfide isomerase